jgi:hypothetical protein
MIRCVDLALHPIVRYQTNWGGLSDEQKAAQKAGLLTQKGKIIPK